MNIVGMDNRRTRLPKKHGDKNRKSQNRRGRDEETRKETKKR